MKAKTVFLLPVPFCLQYYLLSQCHNCMVFNTEHPAKMVIGFKLKRKKLSLYKTSKSHCAKYLNALLA